MPTEPLHVLVTGSRTFDDREVIHQVLSEFNAPGNVLIHGRCPDGADRVAFEVWRDDFGLPDDPHPANWQQYGKRAGFIRNAEMVALKPEVVVAFIDVCHNRGCSKKGRHGSHGATMTAELAEQRGIPVRYTKTPELLTAEAAG